jgi:hypothetical protein
MVLSEFLDRGYREEALFMVGGSIESIGMHYRVTAPRL